MTADEAARTIREALQDGAGPGDARYIYPEAQAALDSLLAQNAALREALESLLADTLVTRNARGWRHRPSVRVAQDALSSGAASQEASGAAREQEGVA